MDQNESRCCSNFWQVNGTCEECPPGYYGVNCSSKCPDGYYGRFCEKECDCERGFECHLEKGCISSLQYVNQTIQDSYITKSEGLDILSLTGYLAIGSVGTIALIVVLVYIKICFQKKRTFTEVISAITTLTGPLTRSHHQRTTCDNLAEEGAVGGGVIVSCGNQGLRTSVNEYSTIAALSDYHTLSNLQHDDHQPLRTTAKIKIERKSSSLKEIHEYEERQKQLEDNTSSLVALPSETSSSLDLHVMAIDLHSSNKAAIETNYELPEINAVFHENNTNGSESHSSEQDLVKQGHAENEQLLTYVDPKNVYESEADSDVKDQGQNQTSKCEYTKLKNTNVQYKNNDDHLIQTKGLEEVYLTPRKELAEVCTNRIEEILSSNDTAIVRDKNVVLSNKDTEIETGYHDEIVLTDVTNYKSSEKENSRISKSPENYGFHDDNNKTTFSSNESLCVNEDEENYLSGHNMHGLQTQNKSLETLTETELQTLKDVHCKFDEDESRKSNFEAKPNCQYNAESVLYTSQYCTRDLEEIRDISKDIIDPYLSCRPYSVVNKKGKHIKHDDKSAAVSVTEDIYAEGETESKEKKTKRIMLNTSSEGIRPYSVVQNANTLSNDDGLNHYMETNELTHHFYDPDWRTLERCKLQERLPDIVLSGEQCGKAKDYVPDSNIDLPSTYRHNQGKASTLPCSIRAVSSNKDDSNPYETFNIHDQQHISKMSSLGSIFRSFREQVRSTFKQKSKSTMREKEKTVFNETLLDQNLTEDNAAESNRPYSVVKKD